MTIDPIRGLIARIADQSFTIGDLISICGELQGRGDLDTAQLLYKSWARMNSSTPLVYAAYFNLGTLQMDMGDLAGARQSFEQAIAFKPDFFHAYINLGNVLERQGDINGAIAQWSALVQQLGAVTAEAKYFKMTALKQIGRVFEVNQQPDLAEDSLRKSLTLDPSQSDVAQHFLAIRQGQCKWPVIDPWEGVTANALYEGLGPLSLSAYADDPIFQLASAWQYNKEIGDPAPGSDYLWSASNLPASGRLRVGYLSSDLREHAVGFLMAEMFSLHNRKDVEVFIYYCGIPSEQGIQERYRATVEHWLDISRMDDITAAKQIADDGIQILVDVNGYTKDARTKMLSLRPAPIIVNWLGYPGTMGSPYHNYIIADEWIIPKGHELFYSEKVLRLPCYQPSDRKRPVAERPTREAAGLPEEAVVFCCFNGTQKITQATFDRWLHILAAVPDSVLWLLNTSDTVGQRLKDYAQKAGLDPERLVFASKIANAHHLARYPLADLFLDCFPYGAHTTASDALWMGVPVLTMQGLGFASRVCASLVRAAGLPELICETSEDYVAKAIELGKDKQKLAPYRQELVERRDSCVLFDIDQLVKSLEELYRQMWQDYQKGRVPSPDLDNLDTYHQIAMERFERRSEVQGLGAYLDGYRMAIAKRHKFRPIRKDKRLAVG